jgi:hypothetical protein
MNPNTSKKAATTVILAAALFGASAVNASTYYLENNNLSQPGSLASVTLTNNGNDVDITVTAIAPSLQLAGFGFNLLNNPISISCNSLPQNYSCNVGTFQYNGGGNFTDQADPANFSVDNRFSEFSFTLLNHNEDDFVANANGNLFATHVYLDDGSTGFAHGGTVPVPAALWLFGSGLLGLIGISRRKKVIS